jgi:AraC-like DNA-binding protein
MLVAGGTRQFGAGTIKSRLLLERRVFAHVVMRDRLVFDARFVPPEQSSSDQIVLIVIVSGTFEVLAPDPMTFEGPVAFLLDENQFEGAHGARTLTFRSAGRPYVGIELRFAREDVLLAPESKPAVVSTDEPTWHAVRALIDLEDAGLAAEAMRTLLRELARQGIVRDDVAASVTPSDDRFARVWHALRPMVERFYVLPTLEEVSTGSGLSLRQLARETAAFALSFRVGSRWRDVMRRLRLKIAVVGLSAPEATIAAVSRAAGYGSTDAMARAFRDAGLPAPSVVQATVRAHPFFPAPG